MNTTRLQQLVTMLSLLSAQEQAIAKGQAQPISREQVFALHDGIVAIIAELGEIAFNAEVGE